ncbi:hypothetical protein BPAE_0117g00260 [Botrytis paeoniae]|uniref:Uncharacterized protein n=1 Tax=Botrytis paeoniae TaxID=278948 RepID=A0A4Z1FKA2_9HELO|nr:hypothetical protein BPAE_0117g00260 [Botrytis paeoniae]
MISAPTTETEINEPVGSIKHAINLSRRIEKNLREAKEDGWKTEKIEVKQRVPKPLGILQEIYRAQWQWSISSHVSSSEEDFHATSSETLAAAVKKNGTCLEGQICPDVKRLESSFFGPQQEGAD